MGNKNKAVKFIGFAVTIIGIGVNLISDWVDERVMDDKIDEKVKAALAQKDDEEEVEES